MIGTCREKPDNKSIQSQGRIPHLHLSTKIMEALGIDEHCKEIVEGPFLGTEVSCRSPTP